MQRKGLPFDAFYPLKDFGDFVAFDAETAIKPVVLMNFGAGVCQKDFQRVSRFEFLPLTEFRGKGAADFFCVNFKGIPFARDFFLFVKIVDEVAFRFGVGEPSRSPGLDELFIYAGMKVKVANGDRRNPDAAFLQELILRAWDHLSGVFPDFVHPCYFFVLKAFFDHPGDSLETGFGSSSLNDISRSGAFFRREKGLILRSHAEFE